MADDYAGNNGTSGRLAVGASIGGNIETIGDNDWFAIDLVAGQSYRFDLAATPAGGLGDPYLELRSPSGTLLAANDDGGDGLDSSLLYRATSSGTYYLNARAFGFDVGGYVLSARLAAPGIDFARQSVGTIETASQDASVAPWLFVGSKWGSSTMGSGTELSYSFADENSVYPEGYGNGQQVGRFALNDVQKAAAAAALGQYAAVANLRFTQTADTAAGAGDIRFANTRASSVPTASAYIPIAAGLGGDVWFGTQGNYLAPAPGNYGNATFIHEIGHALGLKHPHQDLVLVPPERDAMKFSIMSYRDFVGDALDGYETSFYPTSLMVDDIRAIQAIYGRNDSHAAGDTVYAWSAGARIYQTLWDGSGNDTIDCSNQAAVNIDLTPGSYSSVGASFWNGQSFVNDCLAIAFGCDIENARGGAGADTLRGNLLANSLEGGGGDDLLTGGGGADTFVFASMGNGVDTISDFEDADRIRITTVLASAPLTVGDGSSLAGRQVQLTAGVDSTVLWFDTDGAVGAETQVRLSGIWRSTELRIVTGPQGSSDIVRNHAPTLDAPVASLVVRAQTPFSAQLPAAFKDLDADDFLRHALSQADGRPLPDWLRFDAASRTLSGTPAASDTAVLDLRLMASDSAGAQVAAGFTLVVVPQGFSALDYIASHADLRAALGADEVAGASHYLRWGIAENRATSFDPIAYLASNPSLIDTVGTASGAAARHYITQGEPSGLRTDGFDALAYTASYLDLIGAFGSNGEAAATAHFVSHGHAEGRTISFDALRYTATYLDLIGAFGTDQSAATRHYIRFGLAEGRSASFDAAAYVARYVDLQVAFGNDLVGATRHYISHGAAEGRAWAPLAAATPQRSDVETSDLLWFGVADPVTRSDVAVGADREAPAATAAEALLQVSRPGIGSMRWDGPHPASTEPFTYVATRPLHTSVVRDAAGMVWAT